MATFINDQATLAAATLDALKNRAVELESPISDADATAIGAMMAQADVGEITEEKFNSTLTQIASMPKEQFDGMLMMAKMMGGGGVDAMAQNMAAAMGGAMSNTEDAGESKDEEPTEEEKAKFEGPKGEWRMSIPRTIKIDELLTLLNKFKGYANTRYPAKPETIYVDKVVMAIRGCSSVIKKRQDDAVAAGVVGPLVEVLTGVHLTDRETCLRTTQCILGICGKNEDAVAAFKAAGATEAFAAITAQCEDESNKKFKDSNSKDFEKAAEMFA